MMQLLYRFAVVMFAVIASFGLPQAALAGASADYTRQALEKGQWAEAEKELASRLEADKHNDEARFGLALIRFVRAFEKYAQHQYRYGLDPRLQPSASSQKQPSANPKPEIPTYETERKALQTLLDDLAKVDETLADMRGKDVKIRVDLEKVRFDFALGSGAARPTLLSVIRNFGRPWRQNNTPQAFEVAFDQADALWLRGYCHLISANLEFLLAHDWQSTFKTAAPFLYPHLLKESEYAPLYANVRAEAQRGFEPAITNLIVLVHEIRWPVREPERLKRVREHLKQVIVLSRQNWKVILAETDDDHEWLPAPKQKSKAIPSVELTEERVKTWLSALDDFDAVLDGRLLIPHWRLTKGINLRKVLEEPRTFDLVLWVSGHAAVPYLQDGPMLTREKWRVWQRVFGGDFLTFAAYAN